ncbi:hypothetical protein [Kitasatospora griseola]|uniref:hypothetical protein n=1 Tax=Kitasatospora griseola TaxID=2064 RepID=UPI003442BB54
MTTGPLTPAIGEGLAPCTAQDILDSPAYTDHLAAVPDGYRTAAAEYLAAIAGIPDTLDGFDAGTYDERYLWDDDFLPLDHHRGPSPRELREHALAIITMVNGLLTTWGSAVDRLAADLHAQPGRAAEYLSAQAGAYASELQRQRTEQHAWFLQDAGLPAAPRPPVEGLALVTSTGYVPLGQHLQLHP